ncbi:MAG: FAD-dependent oxidoreductase [Planctomycetota bacterium]|jgi:glycerol-3-phosphate dehydrogenase
MDSPLQLDAVVFGGGATGLWLLDALTAAGHRCLLLEAADLGSGQTIASQGIIHGGLKYSLRGVLTASARSIRDMPERWRMSLAGELRPDLSHTRRRAEFCHLWQTRQLRSRMAMLGALRGLAVTARVLEDHERPEVLAGCPGSVARLDEQVIEPVSFIGDLAQQHAAAILSVDPTGGLECDHDPSGRRRIRLLSPADGGPLDLLPRTTILCAGAGNEELRAQLGLPPGPVMQRRPLHMVVLRGDLPELNGHCVDGMATRVTITSTRDHADRMVWQVGGQISELGVDLDRRQLLEHARSELAAVLPGVDLSAADWGSYRVDRAEAAAGGGTRPGDAALLEDGDVITAFPTKLALVPRLVDRILERMPPAGGPPHDLTPLARWPRPGVAAPPWDEETTWSTEPSVAAVRT